MSASTDLVVRPLGPEGLDAYLGFFDRDAFTDNAWWSGCFCNFYESLTHPAQNPDPATPAFAPFRDHNRSEKATRIRAGLAQGFLAFRDGRVVGWLNAQRSEAYANPRQFLPAFADLPERTGLLMCFIVAPSARAQGVGSALLKAAVHDFRTQGLRYARASRDGPTGSVKSGSRSKRAAITGPRPCTRRTGSPRSVLLGPTRSCGGHSDAQGRLAPAPPGARKADALRGGGTGARGRRYRG